MNTFTFSILVTAFFPLIAFTVAILVDQKLRKATEKPPQQEKLLRPPGYSLAIRLEELQDAVLSKMGAACAVCPLAGIFAMVLATFLGSNVPAWWTALAATLFLLSASAAAWFCLCAFKQLKEGRNMRLGLRGEQAVAEALNETADCGYRIFHDLPGGENWNIDHIAIGTRGVFLIETKARRRRKSRNGQPEHVVTYDGKALHFPSGDDTKAIPQAERNARWLAEFLSKKTAEPVTVEPLIVLPGWYVKPQGNFPVKAMNATYLATFLRGQREKIEPAQVRRMIAAVDEKCRDVEF